MTMSKKSSGKKLRISKYELERTASRLHVDANGQRSVVRFSRGQRIEHFLLIISFTMLAVTGLPQRYASTAVGTFILRIFGGIDMIQQIHHTFAFMFGLESIYHVGVFFYNGFRSGNWSDMWPNLKDIKQAWEMILFNLEKREKHPHFGRYTFEEKAEYWALVWGTIVMGISGLMQWFPITVTEYLPGSAIPVARMLHSWEAVLAVLAILVWHSYHVVIKTMNRSIFTGTMSIKEMEEEHPAELAFVEWAVEALKKEKNKEKSQEVVTETQADLVLADTKTTGSD